MKQALPICCRPVSFKAFRREMERLDSPESLLGAAAAICMHENPDADPPHAEAALAAIADKIRTRVRGPQPQAMIAHLHEVLFEEEGFRGDTDDYYNPANSYLATVIQTRRGLPITLSLLYVEVARRLGLSAYGVGLPGHFLAAVKLPEGVLLVDPFHGGREVAVAEVPELLRLQSGVEVDLSDEMLEPVSNRYWLTRMLQNLISAFASAGRYRELAAMLELEMELWPDEDRLQRDLGLVLARCGMSRPACDMIDTYLKNNPDDPQQGDLRQLLSVLTK